MAGMGPAMTRKEAQRPAKARTPWESTPRRPHQWRRRFRKKNLKVEEWQTAHPTLDPTRRARVVRVRLPLQQQLHELRRKGEGRDVRAGGVTGKRWVDGPPGGMGFPLFPLLNLRKLAPLLFNRFSVPTALSPLSLPCASCAKMSDLDVKAVEAGAPAERPAQSEDAVLQRQLEAGEMSMVRIDRVYR